MPKKAKPRAGVKIQINDGLSIIINHQGDVLHDQEEEGNEVLSLQLTAKELDHLAELSSAVANFLKTYERLKNRVPEITRNGEHEIVTGDILYDGGGVSIGCQTIEVEDIARVHKVSLAMRKKHGAKENKTT